MKCKKCGSELGYGIKFCPQCGEKVKLYCTECGTELTVGVRFCPSCGKPVTGNANKEIDEAYKNDSILETDKTKLVSNMDGKENKSNETPNRENIVSHVQGNEEGDLVDLNDHNLEQETEKDSFIPQSKEKFIELLNQISDRDKDSKRVLDFYDTKIFVQHLYPYLEMNEKVVALRHIVHHNFASVMTRNGSFFVKEFLVLTNKRVIKFVKSYWLKPKIKSCYLSDILSIEAAKPGNVLKGVFWGEGLRIKTPEKIIKLQTFGKGSAQQIEHEILRTISECKETDINKVGQKERGMTLKDEVRSGKKIPLITCAAICISMIAVVVFVLMRNSPIEVSQCLSLTNTNVINWLHQNGLTKEDDDILYTKDDLLIMLDDNSSVYMIGLEQPGYSLYGLEVGKKYSEEKIKDNLEKAGYMLAEKGENVIEYEAVKGKRNAECDGLIGLELDNNGYITRITYVKENRQSMLGETEGLGGMIRSGSDMLIGQNEEESEVGSGRLEYGVYKPGTYEGNAQGFGGEVRARVVINDLGIQSVELIGENETPEIGMNALTIMAPEFEKAGSADVDTIVGATVSSKAAIEAVQSALEKAERGEESLNDVDYGQVIEPYEGTWWDLNSQRCYMEIQEIQNMLSITVHWSSGAYDDTEWSMTGTYDVTSDKVLYNDCTMKYIHYEDNGNSTEDVQYINGTGAIYIGNDGFLYWEDNKEQIGSECYFEKETDSMETGTIAYDMNAGYSSAINWIGTYIAEDDQAITVSSSDDSGVVLTFVGYSEEGWQTRTEVLSYRNAEKTQVSDPYYYDGSLVQETVYTITETGIQVETLPSGGWSDGFYSRQ